VLALLTLETCTKNNVYLTGFIMIFVIL